ncbi:hypothetical protein AB0J83_25065 [Actinoplanes sp. NPDC049596]|uniref:hypothetical protein n=1 Tax=unclassified Actinoplanes TaxID=2626549 RepID=UPI00343F31DD
MEPNSLTEPQPIAHVTAGMTVVDPAGDRVGSVTAVQPAGTDVRPDTVAGIAESLMITGYLRIDGTGALSNDVYAGADQLAAGVEGDSDVVTLRVPAGELHRAAS